MPDLTLYITHKNYSSWSLRAWLLMRAFEIPFEEALVPMTADAGLPDMTGVSPTGKVPCLVDRVRGVTIWESIAMTGRPVPGHVPMWPKCMPGSWHCEANVR